MIREVEDVELVVNCLHLSCIFALWNNFLRVSLSYKLVVNCLHLSCIFALWNNKLVDILNLNTVVNCLHLSCIFALWNNVNEATNYKFGVVNCLHLSCIFALWNNVYHHLSCTLMLWIACIYLVSLLFETTRQPRMCRDCGCELLAFILYLCSLKQHIVFQPL